MACPRSITDEQIIETIRKGEKTVTRIMAHAAKATGRRCFHGSGIEIEEAIGHRIGLSMREIARTLGVSAYAVLPHLRRLQKEGTGGRGEIREAIYGYVLDRPGAPTEPAMNPSLAKKVRERSRFRKIKRTGKT